MRHLNESECNSAVRIRTRKSETKDFERTRGFMGLHGGVVSGVKAAIKEAVKAHRYEHTRSVRGKRYTYIVVGYVGRHKEVVY